MVLGTAAVAVAGIIASLRLRGKKRLADNTFVFLGAGEVCINLHLFSLASSNALQGFNACVLLSRKAAIGISDLLVLAMKEEGMTEKEGVERISLIDSKGLVVKVRIFSFT